MTFFRLSKRKSYFSGLVALAAALVSAPVAYGGVFTDGFESPTLNSFWVTEGGGTFAITTASPYAGQSSVHLNSGSSYSGIAHYFGAEQTGDVSVYMQAEDPQAGGGTAIELYDPDHNWVAVFQRNAPGSFVARVLGDVADFNFSAPEGWHQMGLSVGASGISFLFDGTTVFSDSRVTAFSTVDLQAWAGGAGNWDNFALNTTAAETPEPSTWVLALTAFSVTLIRARKSGSRSV